MFQRLWNDEAGFVVSSELVLIATVLVIGLLVGLATIREQLVQELGDVADAISEINQSYTFSAITGHHSSTAGSLFADTQDVCDQDASNNATGGNEAQCIDVIVPPSDEGV